MATYFQWNLLSDVLCLQPNISSCQHNIWVFFLGLAIFVSKRYSRSKRCTELSEMFGVRQSHFDTYPRLCTFQRMDTTSWYAIGSLACISDPICLSQIVVSPSPESRVPVFSKIASSTTVPSTKLVHTTTVLQAHSYVAKSRQGLRFLISCIRYSRIRNLTFCRILSRLALSSSWSPWSGG